MEVDQTKEAVTMKVDQKRRWKTFVVAGATLALVAGMAATVPSVYAGGTIKNADNPDQYISLGMGIRTSFTSGEDRSASGAQWDNTFAVDNARIYINGGIHKYVKFTFNTECFNCSVNAGAGFNGNSNIGLIDAIGKFEITRTVNFWVGRTLVPTERGELNGPFYHQVYDGFRTPFNQSDISGGFGSSSGARGGAGAFGRDQGVVFFGKVDPLGTHLLYAAMVSTGLMSPGPGLGPNQRSTLKYSGRLQWNLLNDEMEKNPGYYTAGGYYGDYGDLLALAVSGEYQNQGVGSFANPHSYATFIGDILFEKVLGSSGSGGVLTANAEYKRYWTQDLAAYKNADCFCMFNGTSVTGYVLYMFPQEIGIGKFQPYGRYTYVGNVFQSKHDEFEAGVNYIISGFNARFSLYGRTGTSASNNGPGNGAGFNSSINAAGTGLNESGKHVESITLALQMQY